jgi:MIP family channel proteins
MFNIDLYQYRREMLAEFIATFAMMFTGTGAIVVNQITQGAITHLGISFVFGGVVAALIYALGHISGAQMNPAVTLALWRFDLMRAEQVGPYILAQISGAIAASTILRVAFGTVANLGATLPRDENCSQAFILEVVLTFILMLVILGAAVDQAAPKGFAGLAIGLTVGLEAACMGPITGASMNPARSFAPALVTGLWQHQWVYWIAPIMGAQMAVWVYRSFFRSHAR